LWYNWLCGTSDSNNLAQLVFHCAFSFGINFCGGSFAYISCIVLTKDYCIFYSSSQSATNFLISFLSLNTYFSVTLLLVMAIFTSTIWIEGFEILGFTTFCFFIGFIPLFLNIFCISLYLGQSMVLCLISPQIWQECFTCLCIIICWVLTWETVGTWSSFSCDKSQSWNRLIIFASFVSLFALMTTLNTLTWTFGSNPLHI